MGGPPHGHDGRSVLTSRRTAWLASVVVGSGAAALSLLAPFVGWTIGLAFVVGALVSRAFVASIGGFLLGGGTAWLGLLLQADRACREFTGPARACTSPDLAPWLAAGLRILLGGAVATIVAARR